MRVGRVFGQPHRVDFNSFYSRFSEKTTHAPLVKEFTATSQHHARETSIEIGQSCTFKSRPWPQNATSIAFSYKTVIAGKEMCPYVSIVMTHPQPARSGLTGFRVIRPASSPTLDTVESTLLFHRCNRNGLPRQTSFTSVERRNGIAVPIGRVGAIGCDCHIAD